ncbi:MAG: aspartate--tRNA ligase [Gemmatimonadetes bacterium]|nr:aspartate--tRNA ligase [Gemmatimonadota bacterium]
MTGTLRPADAGSTQRVMGWVHRRRDLGGLYFIDLRDRSGLLQLSLGPDWSDPRALELVREIGPETVIAVEGRVELRPEPNPELPTGQVEVRVRTLEILNHAVTPAISVYRAPEEEPPSEELRLRHRMLDLRRPELQRTLELRHRLVLAARTYMSAQGFLEIETPILTKPTPEGARDYVVPSRVHPGEFYALPQSPQLYKQILMVAGFDRYFQIARCFRDEDLRADRQPEFTQIDVEASFVTPEDIFAWMEGLMASLGRVAGVDATPPFPRMTWAEAMENYGVDRPDLRWDLEIRDWTDTMGASDSPIMRSAVEAGGRVRGLLLEGGARLPRKEIEAIEAQAKAVGAPGLLWLKRGSEGLSGPMARFVNEAGADALGLVVGGLVLAAAGPDRITSPALSAARMAVIAALGLPQVRQQAWLWVLDFPLFEESGGRLTPGHHPFVLPHPEDGALLDATPARARGLAYDLVYNGAELGSGSIRIHDAAMQERIFRLLGIGDREMDVKFGHLLQALRSGAPPHGGIALGVDRIVKMFTNAPSLRDVVAFPKTTAARALFEGAPSRIRTEELTELGLRLAHGTEE